MAEEVEDLKVNCPQPSEPQPPHFLEVSCKSLDKAFRFAAGTRAGFAVYLINKKLGSPLISHVEAIKDGEESISFGPHAVLVDYGCGWKLQAVIESDFLGVGVEKAEPVQLIRKQHNTDSRHPARAAPKKSLQSGFNFLYVVKIVLAFLIMFVLGAMFTLALENLPKVILLINSYM